MTYLNQHDQHTLQIQRFATKLLSQNVYPTYQAAYKAARLILLDRYPDNTLRSLDVTVNRVNEAIRKELNGGWGEVTDELNEYAVYESIFYAKLMIESQQVSLSIPAESKVLDYVNRSLMSLQTGNTQQAGTWAQFVQANTDDFVKKYDNAIRAGYANGETVQQVARRLRMLNDGLLRNQAEALVRTGLQHYATQARRAMADSNKSVISREVPIVTFDNSLSLTCLAIGSKYGRRGWEYGKSPIGYSPYHFGCRTTIAYLVKGQTELEGYRTAVSAQKGEEAKEAFEARKARTDKKVRYRGRRDSDIFDTKQVRATTPVDNWLRSQPVWFQESLLGKTRAELFRKGDLQLSKFTDATGEPLTLSELREQDALAFEKAGL